MRKEYLRVERNQYYPAGDSSFYEIFFREMIRLPNGATVPRLKGKRKFFKGESVTVRYLDSENSFIVPFDDLWRLMEGDSYEGLIREEKVIFDQEEKINLISKKQDLKPRTKKEDDALTQELLVSQRFYAEQMVRDFTSITPSQETLVQGQNRTPNDDTLPEEIKSEVGMVRKAGLVLLYVIAGICLVLIIINVLLVTVSNLILLVGYLVLFGVGAAIFMFLINLVSGKGKE